MRHWLSAAVVFAATSFLCVSCPYALTQAQQPAGWQYIHRIGAGYEYFRDYDHIGLDIDEFVSYYMGQPSYQHTQGFAGFNFGNRHLYLGLNYLAEYNLFGWGESVFQWLWKPIVAGSADPLPDYGNFPDNFPLFSVIRMTATANIVFDQTSLPDPFSFIWMYTNLPHPSDQDDSLTGQGFFNFKSWDIVETLPGAEHKRKYSLFPILTHEVQGRTENGNPTDVVDLWEQSLGESAHPISLAMPSEPTVGYNGSGKVFGIPEMGDEHNKFTFDGTLDTNNLDTLRLPIATRIPFLPSGNQQEPGLQTLKHHVDWALTNGELAAGLMPPTKDTGADLITPQYLGMLGLVVTTSLSKHEHFGNFNIQLLVDSARSMQTPQWVGSQAVKAQAFFKPDVSTHPEAADTGTPNWWYYYNQTYPSYAGYTAGEQSYMDYEFGQVYIGEDAPRTKVIPVFDHDIYTGMVKCVGVVTVWGLLAYQFTVAHEWEHWWDAFIGDENGPFMIPWEYNNGEFQDKDFDGLDDAWEDEHHLSSNYYDTCFLTSKLPIAPGYIVPDSEIPAHVAGLGVLIREIQFETWKEDWAGLWSTGSAAGNTSGTRWGFTYPTYSSGISPSPSSAFWGPRNPETYTYWPLPQQPSPLPPNYMQGQHGFPGAMHPWYYQDILGMVWDPLLMRYVWLYSEPYQPILSTFAIYRVKDL
jgi:hypothetical protein